MTNNKNKKFSLNRGLSALIDSADTIGSNVGSTNEIEISSIEINPFQPRKNFDEETLKELSISIKNLGIIQPITVRQIGENKYQLVSGERRLRASKLAGLTMIPAFVRTVENNEMLEMALVENIQREDLDSIEIATTYQQLIEECKLTQENLSERIGKNRSTISNYLRLLRLPPEIQRGIKDKKITMGHARALINIDDIDTQKMIFGQITKYDFSVRKVEEVVKQLNDELSNKANNITPVQPQKRVRLPEEYIQLKEHLSKHFHTNIELNRNNKGKGKIVIPFSNDDELENIIGILDKLS